MLTDEKIIDVELPEIRKKRIRIDGDNNRILEFNASDLGVLSRLKESYDKFQTLTEEYADSLSDDVDSVTRITRTIAEIDKDVRSTVDYIFGCPASAICCPDGTMLDPHNGKFRFEYIIDKLMDLYADNIQEEYKKMDKRINSKTAPLIAKFAKK